MTAAVWLPSWWECAAWTAGFLTLIAVLVAVAFMFLGWTGRRTNR